MLLVNPTERTAMSKEITKLEIELSNLTGLWFAGCLRTKQAKRWARGVLARAAVGG